MKAAKFIFLSLILFWVALIPKNVQALEDSSVKRLSGSDRYSTAVSISKDSWDKSDYAILASGQDFPDAVTATPLAKVYDAPILLTTKDKLYDDTKKEIMRLKSKTIFIVGGSGVVSKSVENQLVKMGLTIKRLGGANRYETSILVANEVINKKNSKQIAVVSGDDYTSAESIASIAAIKNMPIILIIQNRIPDCVKKFISSKKTDMTYLIGVKDKFDSKVISSLSNVNIIDGKDKYDVNLNTIKIFNDKFKFNKIYVATGKDYPDALSASAAAAKNSSVLLLAGDSLFSGTESYLNSIGKIENVNLIGGEKVLSSNVIKNIKINTNNDTNTDDDKKTENKKLVICIDAGQEQSSTEGSNGIKAKDVNLKVALQTGAILKSKGYTVIYTRTSNDVSWDITDEREEKFKICNENKADIFVSIHCNYSLVNKDANGVETWYNKSDSKSKALAQYIQRDLIKYTMLNNRGLKINGENGNQDILKNNKAISVLVELGFLSNNKEAECLGKSKYQQEYAEAIANAVVEYNNAKGSSINDTITRSYIKDIIDKVKVGENYKLPDKVTVIADNGSSKQVKVKWNIDKADTSKTGLFRYQGTVSGYSQKAYLVLIVRESLSTKYKIFIDPGHGGYDPGAIGKVKKVKEKDATLGVGLKLGNLLVKNGIDVYFTRISDNVCWPSNELKDLRKRCDMANDINSDLYLSIHCNACANANVSGIETYYCYDSAEGMKAASAVQNSLIKYTGFNNRKIRQQGYYVLNYVNSVSILTELGFITNSKEETLLSSNNFQNKYASALSEGVIKYLTSK